jgi:Fibronectin type III domain
LRPVVHRARWTPTLIALSIVAGLLLVGVDSPAGVESGVAHPLGTNTPLALERGSERLAAPADLAAIAGNTTVSLVWNASTSWPNGSDPSYSVFQSKNVLTGPWVEAATTTGTNTTVTGLVDGTTYWYEVQGSIASALTNNSTPIATVPVGIPYPPQITSVAPVSTSSLYIEWWYPRMDGGSPITQYTLNWSTSPTGPWTTILGAGGTSATWDGFIYMLNGLQQGTEYYVEVTATNAIGTSHPSQVVGAVAGSDLPPVFSPPPDLVPTEILLGGLGAIVLLLVVVAHYRSARRRERPPRGNGPEPAVDPPDPA